jgi:hypothetical protein
MILTGVMSSSNGSDSKADPNNNDASNGGNNAANGNNGNGVTNGNGGGAANDSNSAQNNADFLLGMDFDAFTADGELNLTGLNLVFDALSTPQFPDQVDQALPMGAQMQNQQAQNHLPAPVKLQQGVQTLMQLQPHVAAPPQLQALQSVTSYHPSASAAVPSNDHDGPEAEYILKLFFEELREDCVLISLSISSGTTLGIIRKLLESHIDCPFTLWKSGFLLEQMLDQNTILSLFSPAEEKVLLVKTAQSNGAASGLKQQQQQPMNVVKAMQYVSPFVSTFSLLFLDHLHFNGNQRRKYQMKGQSILRIFPVKLYLNWLQVKAHSRLTALERILSMLFRIKHPFLTCIISNSCSLNSNNCLLPSNSNRRCNPKPTKVLLLILCKIWLLKLK